MGKLKIRKKKKEHEFNRVSLSYAKSDDPFLKRFFIKAIEFATGKPKIEKLYNEVRDSQPDPPGVWELALQKLTVDLVYDEEQLLKVPKEGPVVFIANHPFGVLDGLMLGHLVSRVRPEFFVLVNKLLCQNEELISPFLLPIDFEETKEAVKNNIETRKETIRRIEAGQALMIFPSGGVATAPKPWKKAEDLEWKRFVTQVIKRSEATVIPIFVHGQNSRLFQVASKINMNLRLSLLLNELRNKMGKTFKIEIGDPIDYELLRPIKDRQEMLDYLRKVTLSLGEQEQEENLDFR